MKKILAGSLIFIVVVFISANVFLNIQLKKTLAVEYPDYSYAFAACYWPDRVAFYSVAGGNFTVQKAVAVLDMERFMKKDYAKILKGLILTGFKIDIVNFDFSEQTPAVVEGVPVPPEAQIKVPFCTFINIESGRIKYTDLQKQAVLWIENLHGASSFAPGASKAQSVMNFTGEGKLGGKDKIYVKLSYWPFYKNKFDMNVYGRGISVREFEPLFRKNNLRIDSGFLTFVVQAKSEEGVLRINNVMQFREFLVREDVQFDPKAFFGLSVPQLLNFLKDSKGDFYINFSYTVSGGDMKKVFYYYGENFKESLAGRIRLSVIAAPFISIKDFLWNITGENVIKVIDFITGNK